MIWPVKILSGIMDLDDTPFLTQKKLALVLGETPMVAIHQY